MKNLILIVVILSLLGAGAVFAQDDGVTYTCDGGENDILSAAQTAYDNADWSTALHLAEQGETVCAGNIIRYREVAQIGVNAQAQLDIVEGQAYINDAYPGLVDLGDYEIFMRCVGEGSPTIIFEHGLGTPSDETWSEISPEFENITQVCTYDRAGVGYSGILPPGAVRTTQDMVDDLVNVLEIADIEGPYILVGHSAAGYNIVLFADQHPDDVVGMVMVDAAHPGQVSEVSELFPDSALPQDSVMSSERMDVWASVAEVEAVGDLGDMPLFVLTAGANLDQAFENDQVYGEILLKLQEDQAARSTNSQHVVVEGAPHFIMQTDPDIVIEAIDWVWEQATGETITRSE